MAQRFAGTPAEQLVSFGLTSDAPDESTLRKQFARIDADALDTALGVWMWTRTAVAGQRRVIALDGKTVRGARIRRDSRASHLVAAFDHGAGAVLGRGAVDAKSNEIPAARTLLESCDLEGVVVTVDAMYTQPDTATLICEAGGDYVFTVKTNMPTLHAALKHLPWKDMPATRATVAGRGRKTTRTIKVADVPDWVGFPGAAQIAQLRRTVTGKIVLDLAVTLALGVDCPADIAQRRAHPEVFGPVASDPTVSLLITALVADTPTALAAINTARAAARTHGWAANGAHTPDHDTDSTNPLIIDLDATLVTAHSEKENAAPTYKRDFGFHPLYAFVDHGDGGTGEPVAMLLRAGNAGWRSRNWPAS